jgi:hypothetical protein
LHSPGEGVRQFRAEKFYRTIPAEIRGRRSV